MEKFKFVFIALMAFCFVQCKKKSSDPAPTTLVAPPTIYYVKYTLRDSSYNFSSSKNVLSSLSPDEVGCRISRPNDFYNDIEVSFIEKSDNIQLTYSRLKALEKTNVPIEYNTNANYEAGPTSGICVSITFADTKESYYTDLVAQEAQKGSFYIEFIKALPSTAFSPNTKRCEIKGHFSCTMNGTGDINYELTNGTYYLLYEFWPE